MEALDELALRVRVEETDLEPELPRPVPDPDLELDQGEGSVMLGVALPEHVEVDAVQDLDASADGRHPEVPRVKTSPRPL
jgi:hypothetical protein